MRALHAWTNESKRLREPAAAAANGFKVKLFFCVQQQLRVFRSTLSCDWYRSCCSPMLDWLVDLCNCGYLEPESIGVASYVFATPLGGSVQCREADTGKTAAQLAAELFFFRTVHMAHSPSACTLVVCPLLTAQNSLVSIVHVETLTCCSGHHLTIRR